MEKPFTHTQHIHGGSMSVNIEVKTGVKHGCILFLVRFSIDMDWIMREINDETNDIIYGLTGKLDNNNNQ